jgi:hypothetical protein
VLDIVNTTARSKKAGMRSAEIVRRADGAREDAPFNQLLIFDAQEVARRKVDHGAASLQSGRSDLAVINAAIVKAAQSGLDLASTRICDVLSEAEIDALRAGDDEYGEAFPCRSCTSLTLTLLVNVDGAGGQRRDPARSCAGPT